MSIRTHHQSRKTCVPANDALRTAMTHASRVVFKVLPFMAVPLLSVVAAPSHAAEGILTIQSSGLCLDVFSRQSLHQKYASASLARCIPNAAGQSWTYTTANELRVSGSDRCLDNRRISAESGPVVLARQNDRTLTPGTGPVVWSYPCSGAINQQWKMNADGNVSAWQTGLCLTAVDSGLEMQRCKTMPEQRWAFKVPLDAPPTAKRKPEAPDRFGAAAGSARVVLTWTKVSNASSYVVKRATLPTTYVDTSTLQYRVVGQTEGSGFEDKSAKVGTDYIYSVRAINSAGESPDSRYSCSAAAPGGTVTAGVRPLVYMAIHNSYQLTRLTPAEDAQWAYVRMCLDGLYNNRAGVPLDDQVAIWKKIRTRHVFGINNMKGSAKNENFVPPPPARMAYERDGVSVIRDSNIAYSSDMDLWSNNTIEEFQAHFTAYPNANPTVTPDVVWKGVYVGYALGNWYDSAAPGGALATVGARNALAGADGGMMECIGGLCGSNSPKFGAAFDEFFTTVHGLGKPVFIFASRSGKPPVRLGWNGLVENHYEKVKRLGGWRSDDVFMVIPYNANPEPDGSGGYPALPMVNADGSPADTTTGILYWALHQ